MRITRSTLRRLIAEESARLLREAAEEEVTATNEAERGKKGKKRGGADCLYVTYGGGVYYFVAPCPPPGANEEEVEAAENAAMRSGRDVTAEIEPEGEHTALTLYSWLHDHDEITHVHDLESSGGLVSKDEYMEQVRAVGEEEGLFAEDEFVNEAAFPEELEAVYGEAPPEFDEADKKGRVSPRKALGRYLASHGADDEAVFRAIDRALSRAEDTGEMPTSEDITFNLSDEILDAIPEDDSDKWHSMLEDVLADEFDADAFADAESDRRDVEDTERDLSHPSRFLQEYGDPNDSDPDGGYVGFMASDEEMDYLRGGGSYSDSPYADNDVPDNRYTRGRAKGFNREPRVRGDDIDSGYDDDMMGDDSLSEGEGDSDSDDQFDPDADDLEAMTDRERQRLSAYSFWGDEPGSSLKASHSDFDAHRGADMGVRRFITRGRQGKPHRVSDDGRSIDSGDEDLNESRWAKLAGILKG